jgi:pSer/pThr/pTyr-binding forkhead associated (FHA) protein
VLRDPTSRVRIQSKVMKIGRRPDNDIVVHDLGVSKQHAELRTSPTGRFQVIDLGSHNGTFVNGTRVNQAELQDNDIIAIGHATFRVDGHELIEYLDDGRATFEAHELRVVVHDGGKDKVLLDAVTFPLEERSMMAVIGPAGAGKSTLLNAVTCTTTTTSCGSASAWCRRSPSPTTSSPRRPPSATRPSSASRRTPGPRSATSGWARSSTSCP